MKRIETLVTAFLMIAGTSYSFAQQDADNFYKSDRVKNGEGVFPESVYNENCEKSFFAERNESG